MSDEKPSTLSARVLPVSRRRCGSPARTKIVVHEARAQAGGRCRSYFDPALGMVIDNGNHLLLSGNREALDFLKIRGLKTLSRTGGADFAFVDSSGERWRVRLNAGPLPWWIFSRDRRVPDTRWRDYLTLARLPQARRRRRIDEVMVVQRGAL